jgi:hypothetical protein
MRRFKPRKYAVTRDALLDLREQGEGVRKIGRHFGAHPATVRNWLIRLKLETKRQCIDKRETPVGATQWQSGNR